MEPSVPAAEQMEQEEVVWEVDEGNVLATCQELRRLEVLMKEYKASKKRALDAENERMEPHKVQLTAIKEGLARYMEETNQAEFKINGGSVVYEEKKRKVPLTLENIEKTLVDFVAENPPLQPILNPAAVADFLYNDREAHLEGIVTWKARRGRPVKKVKKGSLQGG